jgi:DNA-directed RNA polymerase specialized sigma24 family protein
MNYLKWVKESDITTLLNELSELQEEYQSALEDCDVYEESGKEIEEKCKIVEDEIRIRTNR